MDERFRADLWEKISDAMERQIRLDQQIQEHANNIERVRGVLGNPYFFHDRPSDDPESRANYTGYASHEPGLQLLRARRDVQRELADLLRKLTC